ncbi:MAG: hypothetical protein O3B42_09970 [Actinomycetota bacterium]|nr:hypothetical protein [Actinomycetota bacterium]
MPRPESPTGWTKAFDRLPSTPTGDNEAAVDSYLNLLIDAMADGVLVAEEREAVVQRVAAAGLTQTTSEWFTRTSFRDWSMWPWKIARSPKANASNSILRRAG